MLVLTDIDLTVLFVSSKLSVGYMKMCIIAVVAVALSFRAS